MLERLTRQLKCSSVCLSLSSPNNFGKSALLRQIALRLDAPDLLPIYLDFNLRADDSTQAFYELIFRKLIAGCHKRKLAAELLNLLGLPYQRLLEPNVSSFYLGQAFMVALEQFLAKADFRLLLIIDEFDTPLATLPTLAFAQLRALKDYYPAKISYLVATDLPLLALNRQEEEGIAEFYELFEVEGLIRLGGLSRNEADKLANTLAGQAGIANFPNEQLDYLYLWAGGHPVLTRLIVQKLAAFSGAFVPAEVEQELRLDCSLRLECNRLWRSLSAEEHKTLLQYLEGVQTLSSSGPLGTLLERNLVVSTKSGQTRIFSQIFDWFVQEKLQQAKATNSLAANGSSSLLVAEASLPVVAAGKAKLLGYDPRREILYFSEELGPEQRLLTGNASLLFKYLFMRQSEPYCTKDELITAIWGNGGYSAENLDRLVSDLRQEIGDYDKQIIRTIPRRGLQMQNVKEWRG